MPKDVMPESPKCPTLNETQNYAIEDLALGQKRWFSVTEVVDLILEHRALQCEEDHQIAFAGISCEGPALCALTRRAAEFRAMKGKP